MVIFHSYVSLPEGRLTLDENFDPFSPLEKNGKIFSFFVGYLRYSKIGNDMMNIPMKVENNSL